MVDASVNGTHSMFTGGDFTLHTISHTLVTKDRDFLVTRSNKDSLFLMATISILTIIFLEKL